MQEIYLSNYQSIYFDTSLKILYELWNSTTKLMNDAEFVIEMEQQILACKQTKPKSVLSNIQSMEYAISVEMQEWLDTIIFPQFIELGVRRIAFVSSNVLVTQISYEQAMDENLGKVFEYNFFETEELALDWLQKSNCICNDSLCTCASSN